jgi:hypothetical protein
MEACVFLSFRLERHRHLVGAMRLKGWSRSTIDGAGENLDSSTCSEVPLAIA